MYIPKTSHKLDVYLVLDMVIENYQHYIDKDNIIVYFFNIIVILIVKNNNLCWYFCFISVARLLLSQNLGRF